MRIDSLVNYIYIALGGALGSVLRVFIGGLLPAFIYNGTIPFSILMVNILGCFAMGISSEVMGIYLPANYNIRLFLISGLLGGFTTFSAFSLEFGLLWQKDMYLPAILYCLCSIIFSIIAFFLGVKLVKIFLI